MDPRENTGLAVPEPELARLSSEWSGILEGLAAELKMVAATTEDEFLAIGSRLQDFYQRSTGIAAIGAEMVSEGGGEGVTGAERLFGGILDEMGSFVHQNEQETQRNTSTLTEILALLDQVAGPLAGFKKINKVLRMLGISTKIESARLGTSAAGFETLANDVGQLSIQVNEKAGVILARKDELAKVIGQTLHRVVHAGAKQQELVIGLLDKTKGSLSSLAGIRTRCNDSITGISVAQEELSRNLGEIVMSMQTHDIVRQQIEHVEESLVDLVQKCRGGSAPADEVAVVCELQTAQLRNAEGALNQAVRLIMCNLEEIAAKQSALIAQTARLAGVADQAGSGVFPEMQNNLAVITGALAESAETNRNLRGAMGSVSETVGDIATFVGEIETIGEEIKLIALNAQIKSALTGEEGAALGVLAEAIQRLSVDAIQQTGEVARTLQAITSATELLFAGVGDAGGNLDRQVDGMVATLADLLQTLRGVKEALDRSLERMDGMVQILSRDIGETVAGITVHQKVSAVLQESIAGLSEVVAGARRIAPQGTGSASYDEIARRYTMQSERNVHQTMLSGAALADGTGDGFGDNVELF